MQDVNVKSPVDAEPESSSAYVFPVTSAQRRVWFLQQLEPQSTAYLVPITYRITGPLNAAALELSLNDVIARHETLRTTFHVVEGEPMQVVASALHLPLPVTDLSAHPNPEQEAKRIAEDEDLHPIDLAVGPLARARLLRLSAEDHVLLFTTHHIVFDGWSRAIWVRELTAFYQAHIAGEPCTLPELPVQYADYAVWQNEEPQRKQITGDIVYWKKQLEGVPALLDLPLDHPRPAVQSHNGSAKMLSVPSEVAQKLNELSKRQGVTLFMTLVAAFQVLLSRYSRQDDFLLGTPVSNRNRAELEDLIGFFATTVLLRADLGGDPSFIELLARVKETALSAFAHQEVSFERLVEELNPERSLSHNALFQVLISLRNFSRPDFDISGLKFKGLGKEAATAKFDLSLFFAEQKEQIFGLLEYNSDLFDESTIDRIAGHFGVLLKAIVDAPEQSVSKLEMLLPEEREQLLLGWNQTEMEYARESCLQQRFEQQARQHPERIAAVFGAHQISYGELNRRANQIARHLQSLGVVPGALVGIYLHRSLDMLAAMIAVLKSGGAYVPLDPAYPAERLEFMVADSGMTVLITESSLRASLTGHSAQILELDAEEIAKQSAQDFACPATAKDLAYVIYTSGSTGKPKGVMIEHRAVVNFMAAMEHTPGLTEQDTLVAVTTLSFDIAELELWLPLCVGAKVVIASREQAMDGRELASLLESSGATVMQATPASWRMLLEAGWQGDPKLKALCGGEALPRSLSEELLEKCGELWNMYGPTETTIWSSAGRVQAGEAITIGPPIGNTQFYILDPQQNPVPQGVAGELYIGGDGLARGYLNRAELTAEKFVAHTFQSDARLYRTGDLCRWVGAGKIEYLGRMDQQVKLRGFRIELGEIEAVLSQNPAVAECVVTVRQDEPGDKRLVAYVVSGAPAPEAQGEVQAEQVALWTTAWDEAYRNGGDAHDATFNIAGWISSYTGEPIPAEEMRDWVEATIGRILSLQAKRIWEIGCGTGLLLFRLAPKCEHYLGTDASAAAIEFLQDQLGAQAMPQVTVTQRAAHETATDNEEEKFDLLVVNSVAQYFPNIEYLLQVLERAAASIIPGGAIFLGDIRSLPLLEVFRASIALSNVDGAIPAQQLYRTVRKQVREESELLIDPEFFTVLLRQRIPAITAVHVQLKAGRAHNEMSRFRYDVVLRLGGAQPAQAECAWLNWSKQELTCAGLRDLLQQTQPEMLGLTSVPNARVMADVLAWRALSTGAPATTAEVRGQIASELGATVEPEDLWQVGRDLGYDAEISFAGRMGVGDGGCDVVFRRVGSEYNSVRYPGVSSAPRKLESYANRPLPQVQNKTVELKQWVAAQLPDYMVPSAWVELERIPRLPNGKIDRKALPIPDYGQAQAGLRQAEGQSQVEEMIAGIWAEVLKLPGVAPTDSFFELGGHSLLATQVMSRIRQALSVEMPVRAIFQDPTVAGLARRVEQLQRERAGVDAPPLIAVSRERSIPLSFAQQRLWFLDQLDPDNASYNVPTAVRLRGALDVAALRQSIAEIVQRHEVLRTSFQVSNGQPIQIISPILRDTLEILDASGESEARRLVAEEIKSPFNLAQGPLFRARLIKLADDDHALVLNMHHTVTDGWSQGLLLQELTALYEAFTAGKPSSLADLPVQYADYAVWQRQYLTGPAYDKQTAYWRQQLADAPASLDLPTDRPRPPVQTLHGTKFASLLSRDLLDQLKALSRRYGGTLFMTLLAAFNVLLSRYSGQQDIVVGTPIAGRNRSETEKLIGFFVNTLALRTDLSGAPTFRELLARVRETTLGAYAHQDVPFEKLVEELNPERDRSHSPIFQVMLALQNAPSGPSKMGDLEQTGFGSAGDTAKFDLLLSVTEREEGIRTSFEYNIDLFDRSTIERMAQHWEVLLKAIVAHPEQPIAQLPMLPETEQQKLLVEWNGTTRTYPQAPVHKLFEIQAKKTPDAVAVVFGDTHLTYRELNLRANQVAHKLRDLGVGPDAKVGISMDRSLTMIVGLLGILKAGGAYVPLERTYPPERLAFMIEDARIGVLLTSGADHDVADFAPPSVQVVRLDELQTNEDLEYDISSNVTLDNLAYVTYTSGSTGVPKGVEVRHRGVVRLLFESGFATFDEQQVFLQLAPVAFDASTLEIWGALLHGGKCVLFPGDIPTSRELGAVLRQHEITTAWLTSSLFNAIIDEEPQELSSLRHLLVGGEALSVSHIRKALQQLPGTQLTNGYGPTENTTFTCTYAIPRELYEQLQSIPIGRPIGNTQVYLLDENMAPVGIGIAGELYIGGDGLARGYLNRPELTAERFVPDPFSAAPHARLYKTGDRVRYLADGNLEFLGRFDDQVKIRGFRIELGEIESVLLAHPAVHQCIVIAREDEPGDKRLAAYIVTAHELPANELRDYIKQKLPDYMVPSALVMLDELPLTANGKIDRKRLPQPEYQRIETVRQAQTPTQEIIAGIWAEVLKLEHVGATENFFELGGHSLLATQVVSRIRQAFSIELPLRALFEDATVSGLASRVERLQQEQAGQLAPPLVAVPRNRPLPLSFAQQRLWFLDQLEPNSAFYNVPSTMRLRGALDLAALERSINQIVARHESLRTSFTLIDGEPVQIIAPELRIPLRPLDLTHLQNDDEREAEARRIVKEESGASFDLSAGPPFRVKLLKLAEQDHILLFNLHHIVTDGWSQGLLTSELATLYEGAALPPLPLQYVDFAVWQRQFLSGAELAEQVTYWKQQLADAPMTLDLPTDRPRPAIQTFRGAKLGVLLPPELMAQLKKLTRGEGATLFMTMLAAFSVLLGRYARQDEVLIGTPIAGRNRSETEKLIGFFVNTLVMRADISGAPNFRQLLARVREAALGAYAHQDLPFEKLVEELNPERDRSRSPIFQVMMALQNVPGRGAKMGDLPLSGFAATRDTSKFDLSLYLSEHAEGLWTSFEYNPDLFDHATIERMAEHYRVLLEAIAANPDVSTAQLPMLADAERRQVLVEFNATSFDFPQGRRIHDLFEHSAQQTPSAIALIHGTERISYAELNARANQVAHYLIERGAGPDSLIGIFTGRSPLMLIGILGILKAGAAYVPLDPRYPKERLNYILEDAQARVVLTEQNIADHLSGFAVETTCLDSAWPQIALHSTANPGATVHPDNMAYVLFTSGSTGRPKGVAIEHRSAVAFLDWSQIAFSKEQLAGVLFSTSMCFDLSVFEMFATLSAGGAIILAENALELPTLPARSEVTLINTVPSAIAELVRANAIPASVRSVALAGEALTAPLVESIYAASSVEKVHNLYGPTEDTTYSTYTLVPRGSAVTIGRPITNSQAYILDSHFNPVPVGVPGELYLAGAGLARGYYGRPELTAERFLINPLPEAAGARMYKTSDLCRWLPNGEIQYLGRTDHQIKLRGFRIELGEIETALQTHPAVQQCVVIAREDGPGDNDKRLAAYIVAENPVPPSELRDFLKNKLPEYMVPSAFVMLDELPLTPNGKIDRKRLPAPEYGAQSTGASPSTLIELRLAQIWEEVLNVPSGKLSLSNDFFDLGGHSLLAVKMMAQVREVFGKELPLALLFQAPTLGGLADLVQRERGKYALPAIIPIRATGSNPPLFCVSRPNVNALGFIFLSRRLPAQQPVYGLQGQMKEDGSSWTFDQLDYEKKAAEYIEAMLQVEPHGPYLLAGFCEGAHIAFEMARQLTAMGRPVALLAILDAWPVENTTSRLKYNYLKYRNVARRYGRMITRLLHGNTPSSKPTPQSTADAPNKDAVVRNQEFLRKAEQQLQKRYWPGRDYQPTIFSGQITVFRAPQQPFHKINDPQLGWGQRCLAGVEVIPITGSHGHILREPHVAHLAAMLQDSIDRGLRAIHPPQLTEEHHTAASGI